MLLVIGIEFATTHSAALHQNLNEIEQKHFWDLYIFHQK